MKVAAFYENMKDGFEKYGISLHEGIKALHDCGLDRVYAEYHNLIADAPVLMPLLNKYGMTLEGTYGFFDFGHAPDNEEYKDILDITRKYGGENALLVPGFIFPEEEGDSETYIRNMISALQKAVYYGNSIGVKATIEDFDGFISPLCTIAGCKQFLDAVPGLLMSFDTGNFIMYCEDSYDAFSMFKNRIATVHAKDRSLVPVYPEDKGKTVSDGSLVYPCVTGSGYIPIAKMVKELEELGYDGTFIVELYDIDPNCMFQALKNSIRWMKETINTVQSTLQLGINCMSLITPMKEDFEGVVNELKTGGAGYLELMSDWGAKQETIDFFAGFTNGSSGWDFENTKTRITYMNKVDLPAKGTFIFDEILLDQAEEMGKYLSKIGIEYVVLSFLNYENGLDTVYEKIDLIRKTAAILKPYGIQITLHNHEHDFCKMIDRDGKEKYIIDIFLEQLSAEELMLELDTGWLLYAGVDYQSYISDNIDRIKILHLKDIARNYQTIAREDIFVPCGKGAVDFAAVFHAVPEDYKDRILYVLDQDASKTDIVKDQLESIRYLKGLI